MNKSRFFTFMLSLIPGCGLMYLGYMKKGTQNMVMFSMSCFMIYFFEITFFSFSIFAVLFAIALPVMWFYQMFDAMHTITRMRRENIETPDDDGFFLPAKLFVIKPVKSRHAAKIIAMVLIFFGGFGIFNGVLNNLYRTGIVDWQTQRQIIDTVRGILLPSIVSIVLIVIGFKLLKGSKNNEIINGIDEHKANNNEGNENI